MNRKVKFSDYVGTLGLILLAVVLVFYFMGCKKDPKTVQEERDDAALSVVSEIVYVEDSRTGLCFAIVADSLGSKWAYAGLTNVPCETVKDFFYRGEGYLGDGR
jgi:hypothetical protein